VEGLVAGRPGSKKERMWPWATADDDTRAPRLHDIEEMEKENDGVVVSVDPTPVPYHRLLNAQQLQVFEPDGRAAIDATRVRRKGRDLHEARRAAYKAQRISEMVASSVASGGARSAASWAAARAHHQALTKAAPVERGLRLFHRALGYGQRPAPPLLTYFVVMIGWTAAQWSFHRPRPGRGLGAFFGSMWHMALIPASFLARVPEQSGEYHYVFGNAGWNTMAFVTMGVPLVFAFIALRHFMAAPSRRS
jgi:hypothetical protein